MTRKVPDLWRDPVRHLCESLSRLAFMGVGVAALCFVAVPAQASLGGPHATVEADRGHFAAVRKSLAGPGYTVDTLALANGGTVKEFTGPDGTVFAVSWLAPGRPDLRQLFGAHFPTLQADNVRRGPRTRAPLAVNRSDLVVQSGGHSGAFWGVAILTQIAPAGFSVTDLK